MKPVTPPAFAPPSLPVLARDDAAEPFEAGDPPSPAGVPRAIIVPARETMALVKSDDRAIAAPAPSPKPPVPALDAETIALLMQQGEQLAEAGDFAAARTLFQRAAEAGDAAAATALGATYDAVVLARMGAAGIGADIVKARFWYEKALRLGSSEAKRRLELLANR
jgi:TPR repeat protein